MLYIFGDFALDPDRYELRHAGEPLPIEPLVLEVLAYLVANRDRTVSKTELLDALWEGEFVTESALTRTIRDLRKALGDSAAAPRFIKTVYGRGYLFVAAVEEIAEPVAASTVPSGREASTAPAATGAAGPPPFVGREAELGRLVEALEAAFSGRGRLVLLAGEPGIGKTRTAQAVAAEAESRGGLALWGRSLEGLRAPPYWPWLQMLRDYLETVDAKRLRAEMGVGAADIAEIAAEVRQLLPDLQPAPAVEDPDHARFRLFDSVARFFRRASLTRPLLLVLDNLHWTDRSSLRMLEFLAHELHDSHILAVGTYRDVELSRQHPLSDTLADLGREGLFERLALGGLSLDEVGRYVRQLAPGTPRALARAVHRQTEGNPFFVAEIVRLLAQEGALSPAGPPAGPVALSIPEGVREVVGRRLNRLPDGCSAVLTVGAVIGRSFGLRELEPLVGDLVPAELATALEAAVAAGVLQEVTGARGRYQFTHALIRETLVDELSGARRARLHRQIGETLEEIHSGNLDECMPQLAHHFFEAALAGTAEKAVDYCVRAARQAASLVANEEAAWHLERALEVLDLTQPADEARSCRLRLECGRALARCNQPARALEMFQGAAQAARRLGSAEMLAEAALGLGVPDPSAPFGLHAEPALRLLEEALAALDGDDSPLRVRLLCGIAAACYVLGRMDEGGALSTEALSMARRLDDPPSVLAALRARFGLALYVTRHQEQLRYLRRVDEMLQLASDLGDTFSLIDAHGYRTHILLSGGDVEGFRREIAGYDAWADRLRQPVYLCLRPMHEASLATLEGRFEAAERAVLEAYEVGRRIRFPNIEGVFSSQMFTLRRLQGRLDEIAGAVEHFMDGRSAAAVWGPGAAILLAELGQLDRARAELERQAELGFESLPRDIMWQTVLNYYGEAACALGDGESARRIYELLLPTAPSAVARGGGTVCLGAASHYLGDLAATIGLERAAREHFEHALELNGRMGARPYLALTEERFARFLAATRGDRARAGALAAEALATARELGMKSLEARARATLEQLDGVPAAAPPGPSAADGLTPREVEVLRLLAAGRSNREVAEALSIGTSTVATHVRSILGKTGSANRAEAAAYAVRNGLTR